MRYDDDDEYHLAALQCCSTHYWAISWKDETSLLQQNLRFGETLDQVYFSCRRLC